MPQSRFPSLCIAAALWLGATSPASAADDTPDRLPAFAPAVDIRHLSPGRLPAHALPAWFEPAGAADAGSFVARGPAFTLVLDAGGARIDTVGPRQQAQEAGAIRSASPEPLSIGFIGSSPAVRMAGEQSRPGVSHYFLGNDPSAWRRDVPHYGAVRYAQLYDGIDALFYAQGSTLEYDFIVRAGADPAGIGLRVQGASSIRIDADGNLVAHLGSETVVQRRPVAYQEIGGARRPVEVAFRLEGHDVRFAVGDYDRSHALIIDPIVVVFASFVGGSQAEFVELPLGSVTAGIATDAAGNLYIAGDSASTSVVPGGSPTSLATPNVFVVKIDPTGSQVLFASYLGGAGSDVRGSLALDNAGRILLSGRTTSPDFPVTAGAVKGSLAPTDLGDAFFARLTPQGVLDYATYLGGSGNDSAEAVAALASRAVIVGSTTSTNFPVTANAAQSVFGGSFDAWVVVVDPDGSPVLTYGSYLGGSGLDAAFSVAVDVNSRVVVSGQTQSTNFPTTVNAFRKTLSGGADAFVTRLTPGGALDYSTYFGGSAADTSENAKVAVNGADALYLFGFTTSGDLPPGTTPSPYQPSLAGGSDAFVVRLWPGAPTPAQQVVYRTYLGGAGRDVALAVELDVLGRAYIAGFTDSTNFPTVNALGTALAGAEDGFIARLDQNGSVLEFSTYVGGTQQDYVLGLSLSPNFGLYALGLTSSATPLPLQSAGGGPPIDGTLGGTRDAFVARFNVGPTMVAIGPPSGPTSGGTPITLTGTDLIGVTTVTVGGVPATSVVVVNATTVTAVTPAGTPGPQDVTVQNAVGLSSTLFGAFTYVTPTGGAPTLTAIVPTSGSTVGGQAVTLTGTNFVAGPGTQVYFGSAAASAVTVLSPTTITAVTPASPAGLVNVAVVNPDGQSAVLVNGYRFLTDFDGDGIDDDWERQYGLDPTDPSDANRDDDGDGASNRKEFEDGTDPTRAVTRYFAEGATISVFSTRFALLNDDATRTATVVIEFQTSLGQVFTASRTMAPRTRITVDPAAEFAALASAEFSTAIRSNLEIAADRTMTWDSRIYGAHAETAIVAPADTWYLAEGATISGFNLFYLIQNPNPVPASVTVRYLLSTGAPVQTTYDVPARSRFNIWVNTETVQGVSLQDKELSAVLTTSPSTPIIVERAMYLDAGGLFFGAGHESAGVTEPATNWFLAEGATGDFFDLFILIANANPTSASVTATYLLRDGTTRVRTYQVAANSRFNIWVDLEPGLDRQELSTIVTSDLPIIVERAMWWPGEITSWQEAHNSPGARQTGTRWVLAEGETGAPGVIDTYILLANTSPRQGSAHVTLVFEDGSTPVEKEFALPANSRTNVAVGFDIGDATLAGKRFGAIVESGGTQPVALVVERAMYWSTSGAFYAAGTNALALRK